MKRHTPKPANIDDYKAYQEELMLRLQPVSLETPPQRKAPQWRANQTRQADTAENLVLSPVTSRWIH